MACPIDQSLDLSRLVDDRDWLTTRRDADSFTVPGQLSRHGACAENIKVSDLQLPFVDHDVPDLNLGGDNQLLLHSTGVEEVRRTGRRVDGNEITNCDRVFGIRSGHDC